MDWADARVAAADGVDLACYSGGKFDAPVVLLVHGYPDDHTVWNGVADLLAPHFHLLAYDVRGAGRSATPGGRSGYGIDQLADDLDAVAATAGAPVHVLAHDWGSVQAWHAVTRNGAQRRYASLTSVSGPSLAYTGAWYRSTWQTTRRAVLRQAAASWYILFFLLPVLPEQCWKRGLLGRLPVLRRRPGLRPVDIPTAVHGLEMYRANVRAKVRPRPCRIPALVLAPVDDAFITVACAQESPRRWLPQLRVRTIEGGHWTFLQHPERVSDAVTAFVGEFSGEGLVPDPCSGWDTDERA